MLFYISVHVFNKIVLFRDRTGIFGVSPYEAFFGAFMFTSQHKDKELLKRAQNKLLTSDRKLFIRDKRKSMAVHACVDITACKFR